MQEQAGAWTCGGWTARSDGAWRLEGTGPRIDALRALCAGVWSQAEDAADAESVAAAVDGLPDR